MNEENAQRRFEGKVALITGAARGQGRSHAVRLAEEGADLILLDACADIPTVTYELPGLAELEETVQAAERAGAEVVFGQADVRDPEQLQAVVDEGVDRFGRLDITLANAGIFSTGLSWEMPDSTWREMIDVNLSGPWRTAKTVIPTMIAGERGGFIGFTSSVAGLRGHPFCAHYVAAKHGIVGVMRTLAEELAPYDIRVNTVHPATTNTKMVQYQGIYDLFAGHENATAEEFATASAETQLLDIPWVEPEEVSAALLWLASDEGRHITGVSLPVDGGATIK